MHAKTTDTLFVLTYVHEYRFAQWFAYHLSNYKYQWDWQLW